MTIYDKFAFRKKTCYVCERRFIFEPYNVEKGYLLFGDNFDKIVCYKCDDKASKTLRKDSLQE